MLNGLADVNGYWLKFVTVPDVVGDHHGTMALFRAWLPALRKRDLPVAFVAQDGVSDATVPWGDIDALFIGGTTRWKEGQTAARLIRSAKLRDKWVHVGRANSDRRIVYMHALGADSFDGTKYSMWPDTHIPKTLRLLAGLDVHRPLMMNGVLLNAI